MALVAPQPHHIAASVWRDSSMISSTSSPISSTTGQLMTAGTFSPPPADSKTLDYPPHVHTKSEYGDIKSLSQSNSSGLISPTTTCIPSSNMSQSSDGDSSNHKACQYFSFLSNSLFLISFTLSFF